MTAPRTDHVHMYFGNPPVCPLCERLATPMNRFTRLALRLLQRRCHHPGNEVVADLLQADHRPAQVRWCRTCGAVAVTVEGEAGTLRRPEPTWAVR